MLSAAPRGVHAAFAVATAQSRGLLQSLWHGHINNGLPSLPRRRQCVDCLPFSIELRDAVRRI